MTARQLDPSQTEAFVEQVFEDSILDTLTEYIRIPNKSPMFDPDWAEHGHMEQVVSMFRAWAEEHATPDMTLEVVRLEGRTPMLFMEIPGAPGNDDTVLLYGHLDKQPEMEGWDADKGPWKPVRIEDRLYGRGGADDGYAMFSSLTAINAMHAQGVPHARCVVMIEACEESGSYDLPFYIDALAERIGKPSLVVCLDSGAGNYDQLWCTASLRGVVVGSLEVALLREGLHSGDASGVAASTFRILRGLLDRIEDVNTGEVKLPALHAEIPEARIEQTRAVAAALGKQVYSAYPFHEGAGPVTDDPTELLLNRTWRPTLSVTGADGLPSVSNAGNVLRPYTHAKLSLRLPPTVGSGAAIAALKQELERDPPYGAKVAFAHAEGAAGWDAPPVADWLSSSLDAASQTYFGAGALHRGEGGSIPFMGMLGEKFPEAQFMITGVLGPNSNAHGPNEFLHIPTAKRLTCCVAQVLRDHFLREEAP